jgi:hypothetical protein
LQSLSLPFCNPSSKLRRMVMPAQVGIKYLLLRVVCLHAFCVPLFSDGITG